jgi:hypothetical protein
VPGAAAVEFPELGDHDEIDEEDERLAHPDVEVIHDADLLVLPVTAASIDDAIESGRLGDRAAPLDEGAHPPGHPRRRHRRRRRRRC